MWEVRDIFGVEGDREMLWKPGEGLSGRSAAGALGACVTSLWPSCEAGASVGAGHLPPVCALVPSCSASGLPAESRRAPICLQECPNPGGSPQARGWELVDKHPSLPPLAGTLWGVVSVAPLGVKPVTHRGDQLGATVSLLTCSTLLPPRSCFLGSSCRQTTCTWGTWRKTLKGAGGCRMCYWVWSCGEGVRAGEESLRAGGHKIYRNQTKRPLNTAYWVLWQIICKEKKWWWRNLWGEEMKT